MLSVTDQSLESVINLVYTELFLRIHFKSIRMCVLAFLNCFIDLKVLNLKKN